MNRPIHDAARELLTHIRGPLGAVNTHVWRDMSGREIIRVLVDPGAGVARHAIPTKFKGYEVVVEDRRPAMANCT